MKKGQVTAMECVKDKCRKKGVIAFDFRCHEHYIEARSKALLAWHDAIAKVGSNCEERPDDFTETLGRPKPTAEQAQMLCFGCKVFEECDTVRGLKIFTDGVILAGEIIGPWEEGL